VDRIRTSLVYAHKHTIKVAAKLSVGSFRSATQVRTLIDTI